MNLQLAHIPQLIVGVFIMSLGIFVINKNTRSSTHQGFFVLSISSALWLILYSLSYTSSEFIAHILFKIGFSFVIFMGVGAYHFCTSYIGFNKEKKFVRWCYFVASLFLFILWTSNYLISNKLYKYNWGYYPKASFFHPVFLIFVSVMIIRFNLLLYARYRESKIKKDILEELRTRYVFWAIFLFCLAPFDFIPNYGVSVYPISYLFAAIYSTMMAYSILKHQLLDIEVIIRRTAVFAGLFAFVYGVFTVFTIIGQEFFKNTLGWNQWIATIPTVFIITFTLRPLENFLTNATERWLFQKKYDYRELLRTFTNETLTVLDLGKLTMQTVESLVKIVKLESAAILLHDKDAKVYKMVAGMGVKEKEIIFKDGDLLIDYLKKTNQHILKDKSVDKIEGEGELKENFKRLNARLCLPIEFHDNLIGILCLGMKKSGEDFTQEDIDILNTLATTEAIAISNATQFDENAKMQAVAAQSEKMAVIGTLAAGINHEICNPLGIVRGQCEMFLLNSRDGFYDDKSPEDLLKISTDIMNKVISQTDRATAITKKLSSFAKPSKRNELEEVRAEKEVDEVLGLIEHDLRLNNIDIQKDFPNNFPVILADKKQIQEVFFNIIRNAAQAMDKKQGKILVSGFVDNGTAVIRIADNGSGIPADKINQVFNPFYTTKAPGKGTGLGLFIVKQVVEKNNGTISLESEIGVGTTFTLRFPIAVAVAVA